jgi:hypothetical protein
LGYIGKSIEALKKVIIEIINDDIEDREAKEEIMEIREFNEESLIAHQEKTDREFVMLFYS